MFLKDISFWIDVLKAGDGLRGQVVHPVEHIRGMDAVVVWRTHTGHTDTPLTTNRITLYSPPAQLCYNLVV